MTPQEIKHLQEKNHKEKFEEMPHPELHNGRR
jgi:hypothetical protein